MRPISIQAFRRKLQKVFWIYLTNNFFIASMSEVKLTEPAAKSNFMPITLDNYFRVGDFRDQDRIPEYRNKLAHKELGFFAEVDGQIVGSIWATINNLRTPSVARAHIRLMPDEALIHDIVTGEKFKGKGVGPFMVARISSVLLKEYAVSRIIIDVNSRNHASLRMMEKAGLRVRQQALYVSVFEKLTYEKVLKQYP
jgi:RimJ/RimL family protein N-acetyltransferase